MVLTVTPWTELLSFLPQHRSALKFPSMPEMTHFANERELMKTDHDVFKT